MSIRKIDVRVILGLSILLFANNCLAEWVKIGEGNVDNINLRRWENDNITVKIINNTSGDDCASPYFSKGDDYYREIYATLLSALHSGKRVAVWGDPDDKLCKIKKIAIYSS
jgi:hypothetical protein